MQQFCITCYNASFALLPVATDDTRVVLNKLPNFVQWRALGRNLGISEAKLEEIEHDASHAYDHLTEVIKHWLRRNHNEEECGPPTWSNLAKAVKPTNNALAMKILGKPVVSGGKKQSLLRTSNRV